MPLSIVNKDITEIACDAIVNPTNNSMIGRGYSVDGKVHRMAGAELDRECALLGGCETGKAKLTFGYNLPCGHIIHTVPPVWRGGGYREQEFLSSCYRESLALCKKNKFKSVAFPILASGSNGYPKEDAFFIAVKEIRAFLNDNEMLIYLVVYDPDAVTLGEELTRDVSAFLYNRRQRRSGTIMQMHKMDFEYYAPIESVLEGHGIDDTSITKHLKKKGETFIERLFRLIDQKGMTDPECYKRANIDRKHFSKLRSGKVRPKKTTVFAFAIALELNYDETVELLKSAGYAFSDSEDFDRIVEYFIEHGRYDIYELNFMLNKFNQPILGAF